MRIFSTNLIVAAANLLAGLFLAVALQQSNIMFSIGFAVFGMTLAGVSFFWQVTKTNAALAKFTSFMASPDSTTPSSSGLTEIDQLAVEFASGRDDLLATLNSQSSLIQQTQQIEALIVEFENKNGLSGNNVNSNMVERFQLALNTIGKDVESSMHQALACSREIGRGAQQLVVCADDQTDAMNRITNVIENMSSQIMQLNENAESAVESSAVANKIANDGLTQFQNIAKELETVQNHVSTRERKLQLLSQHTREIGGIVESVGTLSSRTDLLALNASIESARAGEHGRGFALVAEEVRSLAEQTAQSVSDISTRVELMQQETQDSITVTFGEQDQIHRLIKQLDDTLSSMSEMNDVSDHCASSVAEISGRTQQQLRMLMSVVQELETSTELSKGNRIQAEGVHWTAKTLEQLGEQFAILSSTESMAGNSNQLLQPQAPQSN